MAGGIFHVLLLLPLRKAFPRCQSHTAMRKKTPILAQAQDRQLQSPAWLWFPEAGSG